MKLSAGFLATAFVLSSSLTYAQSSPGGPGTPRPAASSASKGSADTTGMAPNKSGTSTSGGSDANGDQGRDTMPNSSKSVMPLEKQNKPEK
jgi:hypothetical protein